MTRCPTCKKPVAAEAETFPFCQPRCKLLDLGNWMTGRYVVSSPLPLDESEPLSSEALARALQGRDPNELSEDEIAALAARLARTTSEAS